MSENDSAVGVQQGDIKCHRGDVARQESDGEVCCFGDHGCGRTIKKLEDYWRDGVA